MNSTSTTLTDSPPINHLSFSNDETMSRKTMKKHK